MSVRVYSCPRMNKPVIAPLSTIIHTWASALGANAARLLLSCLGCESANQKRIGIERSILLDEIIEIGHTLTFLQGFRI